MDMIMRLLALGFTILLMADGVSSALYTNQIAVHIEGGALAANVLAKRHGFINLGQIGSLEDHYLFEHPHLVRRSVYSSQEHINRLKQEPQVRWLEQQIALERKKRLHLTSTPYTATDRGYPGEQQNVLKRKRRHFTDVPYTMADPLWPDQWFLHREGHLDMNVIPAWLKGYTGKGVVVSMVDDGIERTHPDLVANYDPRASYDVNGRDSDPMPRYDITNENRQGTRCAGEVSATANNSVCGVGVAFGSSIGGIRMLDGAVTDAVEAASFSFNPQYIDIYSAGWGPADDGRVVDEPGTLTSRVFINGITKGRRGLGSIYVWASGIGGDKHDNCNCDGYTNSIFTMSISSVSEKGVKPWYVEECSSTIATAYSSGGYREKQIVTTDLHSGCTWSFTGTSPVAALAAGILALTLEANSNLTWRDVQYITMLSARTDPLIDGNWVRNSVGKLVSHRYGFGLMDASAMVDMAEKWQNVPPQHTCETLASDDNVHLSGAFYSTILTTDGCAGMDIEIQFVEHVQVNITISSQRRGDISLYLTSPGGTKSTLLAKRMNDRSSERFHNWPFMSVHFWGEDPRGMWKLEVQIDGSYAHGILHSWSLRLNGVATNPMAKNPSATTNPSTPPRTDVHYSTWRTQIKDTEESQAENVTVDSQYGDITEQSQTVHPSTLVIRKNTTDEYTAVNATNVSPPGHADEQPRSDGDSHLGLGIGLTLGAIILVSLALLVVVRHKRRNSSIESVAYENPGYSGHRRPFRMYGSASESNDRLAYDQLE